MAIKSEYTVDATASWLLILLFMLYIPLLVAGTLYSKWKDAVPESISAWLAKLNLLP